MKINILIFALFTVIESKSKSKGKNELKFVTHTHTHTYERILETMYKKYDYYMAESS